MPVRSDRTYEFDRPATEVWDAIATTDEYEAWWPWLRDFTARGLVDGDRWSCTVRPPLPYVLRFDIDLVVVERPTRIEASVSGDIVGDAAVLLRTAPGGCTVRLASSLQPMRPLLRGVDRWVPGLARHGHDWVLDTGLEQFRRRALGSD